MDQRLQRRRLPGERFLDEAPATVGYTSDDCHWEHIR
jgi:hypothetical protein